MMNLKPLSIDDILAFNPYFQQQPFRMSESTIGFQYMWLNYEQSAYAIVHNCLCLRYHAQSEAMTFSYPLSLNNSLEDELSALDEIESWCIENYIPFILTEVPQERILQMVHRYGRDLTIQNPRTWRDYLYNISDFVHYAGKAFSGQRNHVSKFHRLYPTVTYRVMTREDKIAILAFLEQFSVYQCGKHSTIATEELKGTALIIKAFGELNMQGGILEDQGKIIAITIGEIVGDTLIVHIEKALSGYDGVYPTIAQEFAKSIQCEGVTYINREDDAGDCGLRKSKLQYNPIQIIDKYTLIPKRMIESIHEVPTASSLRISLRPIAQEDGEPYRKLAGDLARSKLWGWDWSEVWQKEDIPPATWFMEIAAKDFETHTEISDGIYFSNQLIGEITFYHFTYVNTVELGVRLLPEFEGQGFAAEAMKCASSYALCQLGMDKVIAKCYKENLASLRMLKRAGFQGTGNDDTYYYFERTAKN